VWFVPVLCVLAGAGISVGTIAVDRATGYDALPRNLVGGPDAATAVLSTVSVAMVSLTTLVLTITMVVVQLAMGQFSPRIVQRILQDKPSQLAIGLFVATFVHSVLALREITNNGDGTGKVPGVAVLTAFVLVLASIAVLVIYVQHIGQALRVSALIELVGADTRKLLDRVYAERGEPLARESPDGAVIVRARRSGVVTTIGSDHLVREAARADCLLELVPALGEFVPADAPLFRVHGNSGTLDEDKLHEGVVLKLERTLDQDVAYGMRMLVDIGERSLAESPYQDPTTTVQAIDRLHDLLRQLVRRPFPDGRYRDADGEIRLTVRAMTWEAYVLLATEEIRRAGAGSPQVTRRLQAALLDLRSIAPPERRPPLDRQLKLMAAAAQAAVDTEHDLETALQSDALGIGPDASRSYQTAGGE
jgi:uncharacterized membrane protein